MLGAVNGARLLFPDFSLILCGFLLCRFTPLSRPLWEQVEKLVYFFLFPVLLFQSIMRSPLDLGADAGLVAAGLGVGLTAIALSYACAVLPGVDRRDHAGAAQVAFRFNSFIGLALAERLGGARGLGLVAVLIGVCVPLFNIAAVWPMARHGRTHFGRALLRNPLILATGTGLAANLAGLRVPALLDPVLTRIGGTSLALGLLAAGAGLQLGSLARQRLLTASVLAIRHLVSPLVAWTLARLLHLDAQQATILLLFSALPTASSAYVLASRMGFNGPHVAGLVTLSTLLGMASLPFALGLLG